MSTKTFFASIIAITAAAAAASSAQAAYSTSFEAPTYTAGTSVAGVDGWVAGSGSGLSQTVSTAHADNGTQGLTFDNTGTLTSFYSVYHSLGTFTGSTLTLSVDLYIPSTNGADRLSEIEFSTGILGSGVLGVSIDGAGNIRMGKSWSALYSTSTTAGTAQAGSYADRWLTATLTLSPAGLGTVTLSGFGGTQTPFTQAFTAVSTPTNVNLGSDYLTTAAPKGTVSYDNLNITSAAVPEPSTVICMTVAGMVLVGRCRRRKS